MNRNQQRYIGYLLRLWQSGNGKSAIWRASLQCTETGKRRAFSNIDALVAFLWEQVEESDGVDSIEGDEEGGGENSLLMNW